MQYKKLDEIATKFRYGKLPDKSKITNNGAYPIWTGYRYVGYYNEKNINKNEIVVVARGVGGTGYVKICKEDSFLTNLSIAFNVNEDINPFYVYYYYQIRNLRYLDSGSAQSQITINDLKNVKIPLPNKNIQDKIAKILFDIDSKIELNNKINKNLFEIAINYLNEKIDYNNVPISKFAKIQGGYAFKSKDLINTYTNNRIIKIKNIRNEINTDVINSQYVEDEVIEKVENKFRLNKGDVVIAMTGAELGKTGFIYGNDNYYINQRVGVIRGKNKESELYLNILFLSKEFQSLINSKGYGTAQPNISTSDIENILINDISESNLNTYYEIIKPIYDNIISNCEEELNLSQLRDTLLPRLMNGEIDLENINI